MTFSFAEYAQVKDKYCIYYPGPSANFVKQLIKARPLFERTFPGLQVYLCCRDSLMTLLEQEPRVLASSQLDRKRFGCVREMKYNLQENPVEAMLKESGIAVESFADLQSKKS